MLDIASMSIQLSKHVTFIGNTGSAIVAKSAQINVLEGTVAEFVNNTASYGGAMALHGFSFLKLFPGSEIVFDSNHASELGGAVYATSPHQSDFIFSHKCFISYSDVILQPHKWNTSVIFYNNSAKYGYAVYTDSLLPCAKNSRLLNSKSTVNSTLKWTPFTYTPAIVQYTIATSPANIQFTLPPSISPGERINILPISKDDLDQTIPSAYQVIIESAMGSVLTSPYISDDGFLQITGKPGTAFNLTLKTQNTRQVSLTKPGRLENCPFGFILNMGNRCVCSAATDSYSVGIPQCNMQRFQAYLQTGYWAGCTDFGETITGYCPFEYCYYKNSSFSDRDVILPKRCKDIKICSSHRQGQFCGECEKGYTVYYHSQNYQCGKCKYGAIGILIYILSELLPLVLLFAAIMILKLNMTSGILQSLLLFAQTITLINHVPSSIPLSQASYELLRIHQFLFGFLNMDFLQLDELSFCLWTGATVLDNLLFGYLTIFFAFLFLGALVLAIEHTPINGSVFCCKRMILFLKKSKTPIIHCITTFLILPYTKYTVISFQILSRLTVIGEGGVSLHYVVELQGNMEYCGAEHLPYAIPAVLVLLFFTLPPPLLLISYPLLWRVKGRCRFSRRMGNDTTIWPIRKLLPLIDSFQGVFKDNCRMFAGLLLLWRVILASIFAFSTNLHVFYLLTTTAILSFFTIHVIIRPYKRRLYNFIDILMLGNIYIITHLSRNINSSSLSRVSSWTVTKTMLGLKIMFMYLPLFFLVGFMIYSFLKWYHVLPENFSCLKFAGKAPTFTANVMQSDSQRQSTVVDEDLFARASELNSSPMVLSTCESGVELHAEQSTAHDYTDVKESNGACDALN